MVPIDVSIRARSAPLPGMSFVYAARSAARGGRTSPAGVGATGAATSGATPASADVVAARFGTAAVAGLLLDVITIAVTLPAIATTETPITTSGQRGRGRATIMRPVGRGGRIGGASPVGPGASAGRNVACDEWAMIAGSAACACGRRPRAAATSPLQCLQRPAIGWIEPPQSGHGIRASADSCSAMASDTTNEVWIRPLVVVALLLLARPVAAEPSDTRLVLTGLAMAPPTYLVGVTLHEGSHAIAAKLVGAEVLDVHLFPPGRDPRSKAWRFGWTYVRGIQTKNQRIFFLAAPKITDTILLGGFAALVFTDAWPSNAYGRLALTVFATGLWIDFAKDLIAFRKSNDVVRVLDAWCLRGWRQIPARLVYAAAAAGLGYVVARGYRRTFGEGDDPAAVMPLASVTF